MAGACRARQVQEEQAVMAKIGVLSTRTRVEEKQLIAALAVAGVAALPVPPAALPSPLGPSPVRPLVVNTVSGVAAEVMIDRLQDRALASAALRLVQANGGTWIGAGLAATENRLTVATTLARAGVARPESRLVFDEGSALTAIEAVSYPCSFTPLESKLASIVLADRDTAEAVMEHRDVLGARHDALGIIQAGIAADAIHVIVLGGSVIGYAGNESLVSAHAFSLAIAAAQALHADIVGISVMRTASGLVVWDVDPVPDFRSSVSIGSAPVADAIASYIVGKFGIGSVTNLIINSMEFQHDVVAIG
jgi:glutathione synthase/RimK-type ligase-like ATP-grasp enzyme